MFTYSSGMRHARRRARRALKNTSHPHTGRANYDTYVLIRVLVSYLQTIKVENTLKGPAKSVRDIASCTHPSCRQLPPHGHVRIWIPDSESRR